MEIAHPVFRFTTEVHCVRTTHTCIAHRAETCTWGCDVSLETNIWDVIALTASLPVRGPYRVLIFIHERLVSMHNSREDRAPRKSRSCARRKSCLLFSKSVRTCSRLVMPFCADSDYSIDNKRFGLECAFCLNIKTQTITYLIVYTVFTLWISETLQKTEILDRRVTAVSTSARRKQKATSLNGIMQFLAVADLLTYAYMPICTHLYMRVHTCLNIFNRGKEIFIGGNVNQWGRQLVSFPNCSW